jgi:hypothetical protein
MGAACTASGHRADAEPLALVIAGMTRNDPGRTRVDLSCRGLGLRGAQEVSAALCNNTVLRSLFVGWNDLEDAGVQVLCNSVRDSWSLTTLVLAGNRVTDDGAAIVGGMLRKNRSLTLLSLSANLITLLGARALLHSVDVNGALRSLSLGGNRIAAPSIDFVTAAIQRNVTLSSLELGGNDLGPETMEALERWCRARQLLATPTRTRTHAERTLSQCADMSSGPRDDDFSPHQWDDKQSGSGDPELWRLDAASMLAQVCLSDKLFDPEFNEVGDPPTDSPCATPPGVVLELSPTGSGSTPTSSTALTVAASRATRVLPPRRDDLRLSLSFDTVPASVTIRSSLAGSSPDPARPNPSARRPLAGHSTAPL